jgi:hypothetical protein
MIGVVYITGQCQGFQGQGNLVKTFLMNMPKDCLNELQPFARGMLAGPLSQHQCAARCLQSPETSPTKTPGVLQELHLRRLAVRRVLGKHGPDLWGEEHGG